jgi:hypothetical protein
VRTPADPQPTGTTTGTTTTSSSSSAAGSTAPAQQQQQQEAPLHSRLQYLLSHGQRYSLRLSLLQLRQEAGRRGWKWAFGAGWVQRARLLAEAEDSRR